MCSVLYIQYKLKKLVDNRFSSSSIYKYKKFYKIKYRLSAIKPILFWSYNLNSFFTMKLSSKTVRLFKFKQLKSVKMFIRKPYTKIISLPVNTYKGFTKKPSEVRMGKGKASKVAFKAFPMRRGSTIILLPERFYPKLAYPRALVKLAVYSNKFTASASKIYRGFFLVK